MEEVVTMKAVAAQGRLGWFRPCLRRQVKPTKTGFDSEWKWSLPQDAQGGSCHKKVSTLGEDEHLGEFSDENGMSETAENVQSAEDAQDAHVVQRKGAEHLGHLGSTPPSTEGFDSDAPDPEIIEGDLRETVQGRI